MKKLGLFTSFDFNAFSKGKQFMSTGVREWKDHETGAILGTKIEAVIVKDRTDYGASKYGEKISNLFEKVIFKVRASIDVPLNVEIVPVNAVATVYGEYRNQLSITADDVQVVSK
jgi:hypothetical protein